MGVCYSKHILQENASPATARSLRTADVRSQPGASRRLRRRGPRSLLSLRSRQKRFGKEALWQPPGGDPCESGSEPSLQDNSFTLSHANIHGFTAHRAELSLFCSLAGHPGLIALNETLLDESVQNVSLDGYVLVSRLDRRSGGSWGGICLFACQDFARSVSHLGDSDTHERSWHTLHSDYGPLLICIWYRPPCYGEIESLHAFVSEWRSYSHNSVGTLVVGDLNIHQKSWLTHSSRNTPEGRLLAGICNSNGLAQLVRCPTRGKYLLDLVLSDLSRPPTTKVLQKISDHNAVLVSVNLRVPVDSPTFRDCWDFAKADWRNFSTALQAAHWPSILGNSDVNAMVERFNTFISACCTRYIPTRQVATTNSSQPWLNARCMALIQQKHNAEGTHLYFTCRDKCSRGLKEEFHKFVRNQKSRLNRQPGKKWWKLANMLSLKEGGSSCIPPLRDGQGNWMLKAQEKADLFAESFLEKFATPLPGTNEYSNIRNAQCQLAGFLPVRLRQGKAVLKGLRQDSATGPDKIGTSILRRFHVILAQPLVIIARQMLVEECWPAPWRTHWVFPLYKKRCKSHPGNYRGIHLSSQMSKACERLLGQLWVPYLENTAAFGVNQFAYRKRTGYRDAMAFDMFSWISAFSRGQRVALHCGDVAGAFDKVSSDRLLQKLRAKGLHPKVVAVIGSWLQGRSAHVIVEGKSSIPMCLVNMVFQGTVWGPVLWNVYYEDVHVPVRKANFQESAYADDLIGFRCFPASYGDEHIWKCLRECQREIHKWGEANAVTFDAAKESQHILDARRPGGDDFKLLGLVVDPQLSMFNGVLKASREANFRLRRVLRLRTHFQRSELVQFYKSEVLSYVEGFTPGIYHAAPSVLQMLDDIQASFLDSLGLSDEEALLSYNLAPLGTRRDMAMLGLLHRVSLKAAPVSLLSLFPSSTATLHSFMAPGWLHCRQLADPIEPGHGIMMRRSIFGLVAVYNRLPKHVAEKCSVTSFQRATQGLLKDAAGSPGWRLIFRRVC